MPFDILGFVIHLHKPNKPHFNASTLSRTSPGFHVSVVCPLKTQRAKEKLLVMSNFSFSHGIFYPFEELSAIFIIFEIIIWKLFQFGRVYNLSFGKGLTHYHTAEFWNGSN